MNTTTPTRLPRGEALRALVDRVRAAGSNTDSPTSVPAFDHQVHDPEEDAITILPSHKVILVEGNYLLLPDEPWRELWDGDGALLDERWFVDTAVDDAMTRVMGRHVAVGRSAEEAKSRAAATYVSKGRTKQARSARAKALKHK